ncbi:DUF3253 domain-containing protein [uncultured Corynebacterium sp.]|nr:DUF3253 domain-containing protein [uncultured Corynebacterium sp.]
MGDSRITGEQLRQGIMDKLNERKPESTICPSEVARGPRWDQRD